MKNYEVGTMLESIKEVAEFKSDNLKFVTSLLKAKRQLIEKQDEFTEILKAVVSLDDKESELLGKIQKDKDYNLSAADNKIKKSIDEKNVIYNEKTQELMIADCDLQLPTIKMEDFPKETLIKQFDELYILWK